MTNRRDALRALGAGASVAILGTWSGSLLANSAYTIAMRNADPSDPARRMVFTPDLLKVPAGSQIHFSAPEGAHNTQSTLGMLPDGAEGWRFGIRKSGTITLSQPGFYGYHCLPHRSMGMVGLIIVEGPGMMENLSAAKAIKQPPGAAARWADLWERAEKLI